MVDVSCEDFLSTVVSVTVYTVTMGRLPNPGIWVMMMVRQGHINAKSDTENSWRTSSAKG